MVDALSCQNEIIHILDVYGRVNDMLWIMDILNAMVKGSAVESLFKMPEVYIRDYPFEHYSCIKSYYAEENYKKVIQQVEMDPSLLAYSPILFFYSECVYILNATGDPAGVSRIDRVESMLSRSFQEKSIDSFCLYVLGMIWKEKNDNRAISAYIESIRLFPYMWSCWVSLVDSIADIQQFKVMSAELEPFFLKYFFQIHATNRIIHSTVPLSIYNSLIPCFPTSVDLVLQMVLYYYNEGDFAGALQHIAVLPGSAVLSSFHIKEYYSLYSNILYSLHRCDDLFALYQRCLQCLSTCAVTYMVEGSYWSLQKNHTRAIAAFSEAIHLDALYYDAMLLLGHEYMDNRQWEQSKQCYEKAIVLKRNDYRSYFSLGCVYEEEGNDAMCLYYYLRSVAIEKHSSRIWYKMGALFEKKADFRKSEDAYEKGYVCDKDLDHFFTDQCFRRLLLLKKRSQSDLSPWKRDGIAWLTRLARKKVEDVANGDCVAVIQWILDGLKEKGDWETVISCCNGILTLYDDESVQDVVRSYLKEYEDRNGSSSIDMEMSD